jgi:hypothetical protein
MSTKKNTELINPKHGPLTPEKLRELPGLNLSDEQAEEVIWSLTRYARLSTILAFNKIGKQNAKTNQNEPMNTTSNWHLSLDILT